MRWPKYFSFSFSISQGWFPIRLTDLISLQYKGLSRVFSRTTVQKHQFFGVVYDPSLTSVHGYQKNHSFDYGPLLTKWCFCFLIHCLDLFWNHCFEPTNHLPSMFRALPLQELRRDSLNLSQTSVYALLVKQWNPLRRILEFFNRSSQYIKSKDLSRLGSF